MTEKYLSYAEYKDSGVEWLEEIPDHWNISKLKFSADIQPSNVDKKTKDGEVPVMLCNYTDEYYNDEADESIDYMRASATDEQLEKFTLKAGDTIITKDSEDPSDIAVPAFVPNDLPGVVCGYHLAMIRPKNCNYGAYIKRVFESGYAQAYFETRANGLTRYGLGTYPLCNVYYQNPTESEAITIANFLEHETAKIDTLITKQQQLIKLLKEKRQAVISHAVTKGLNPDAPMKDSGVEWLGEVPEHWEMVKFSHCAGIRNGQVDPKRYPYKKYTLVAPNHIESGTGRIIALESAEEQGADSGKYLCCEGEIIYSKIRPALAKVCISLSDKTICSADMYPISGRNGLTNQFLFWFLLSKEFTTFAVLESDRVAMPKINRESLADIKVPVPPEEEQNLLFEYIDRNLKKLDLLTEKAELTISLLQERRTAIVSAAVTGKIDVRNWNPEISEI